MLDVRRMTWFRTHIKGSSRLALMALAMQLIMSFGHVHVATPEALSATFDGGRKVAVAAFSADGEQLAIASAQSSQDDDGDHRRHGAAAEPCTICTVTAMAGCGLIASPPALARTDAGQRLSLTTSADAARLDYSRAGFQPRGPPLS